MNQQKQVKSSSIFLLELILAIFFFSLASAVCVQIFVKAHVLSQNSKVLHFAVNECGSQAETISVSTSINQLNLETLYYDENLSPSSSLEGTYKLSFIVEDVSSDIVPLAEAFSTIKVQLFFDKIDDASSVYSLEITHHFAKEVQP